MSDENSGRGWPIGRSSDSRGFGHSSSSTFIEGGRDEQAGHSAFDQSANSGHVTKRREKSGGVRISGDHSPRDHVCRTAAGYQGRVR